MIEYPEKTPDENPIFRFFLRQKESLNILFWGVIIAGTYLSFEITKEAFGSFDFDLVTVTTRYPGATPEEVEQLVTAPLENAIKTVEGIDKMHSTSAEGISAILLELDPDAPSNAPIIRDIEREVDRVTANELPERSEDPLVREITSAFPVLTVGVAGDVSPLHLREIADRLEDDLLDLDGVSRVSLNGFLEREMWVETTPEALARHHLSLNDLIVAVRQGDVNIPGGRIETDEREISIRAVGRLQSPGDVRDIVVRSNEMGEKVSVGDIARITDRLERERQITRINGRPSIQVQVLKQQKGDTLELDEAIRELLVTYRDRYPDISFTTADESAFYIRRRLNVLLSNGAIGMGLVLLMMFLFLSGNSAVWTAASIPFAFLGGLITVWLMGYSINLITLFAFVLVSGMLVDTGIVISENIERRREQSNAHPFTTASEGVSEMALPVFASVLTTVLAFAPLGFMSGIVGKFLRQMPVVLIACLAADLLEAFFILPSHLYHYTFEPRLPKFIQRGRDRIKNGLDRLTKRYRSAVEVSVRRPFLVSGVFLGVLIVLGLIARAVVDFRLFPVGVEEFTVSFELPVGTRLESTSEVADQMEEILLNMPKEKVETVISYIGSAPPDGPVDVSAGVGVHQATFRVILNKANPNREGDELVEEVRPKLKEIADRNGAVEFNIDRRRGGPPTGAAVEVKIKGPNFDVLQKVSTKALEFLRNQEGVIGEKDDYDEGQEEIRLGLNRAAIARTGLPPEQVATVIRSAFDGVEATEIRREKEDDAIAVIVKLEERFRRSDTDTLSKLYLTDQRGRLLPLPTMVEKSTTLGPRSIQHLGGRRTIAITADVNPDIITSQRASALLQEYLNGLLKEYPEVEYEFGGEEEDRRESLASLFKAMAVALLLIYIVLTALFRSYTAPLAIITVIPFALIGVLLTLILHHLPLSLLVLIGFAGLMGVVINNSILMIQSFKWHEERSETDTATDVADGSAQRFRPIFLTSFTTLFAVMPLGYGIGGREPFLEHMALTFGWGLFFCTMVTLFWTPAIYMVGVKIRQKMKRRRT